MSILFFSIFLIIVILLIKYFSSTNKRITLKLLTYFGIIIGMTSLGCNFLFSSCFGASTPIDIKTQNLTEQNLKIYAIAFWQDYGSGTGSYVHYISKLKPNETSEFCIDNDGGKFWLVAKNMKNEITYIRESFDSASNFNFKIITNQNIKIQKILLAKELTFKTDKSRESEQYLLWTNIILIGILAISLFKK